MAVRDDNSSGTRNSGVASQNRFVDNGFSYGMSSRRYTQRAPNAGSTLATGGNVVFFGGGLNMSRLSNSRRNSKRPAGTSNMLVTFALPQR